MKLNYDSWDFKQLNHILKIVYIFGIAEQTVSARTFRAPKQSFTNSANIRDYEIIDDDDLENRRPGANAQAAAAAKRRASSKQMNLASSVSNYKSNEVIII